LAKQKDWYDIEPILFEMFQSSYGKYLLQGHALFWHLKAELHVPQVAERYCLLLEAYLRGCGDHRKELIKQGELVKQLVVVADKVKKAPSAERKPLLKEGLKKVQISGSTQLPLERR